MRTSLVIPVYNDKDQLRGCLECVAQQTQMPSSVIVVDNNCSDGSIEMAKQYSFVTVISEPVQGICAATKAGLDFAAKNSDLILRCDADSRPPTDWTQRVVELLSDNSRYQGVTGPGRFYDMPWHVRWLANWMYMRAYFWSIGLALGQKPLFGSNFAIRSSIWTKIQNQTHLDMQNIHDDIDISYHLTRHGKIHYSRGLIMPISGRPFKSPSSLLRRYPIGLRSILIHWPEQAPWRR